MADPPAQSTTASAIDRDLLAFAAEHRFVLAEQIGVLLSLSTDTAARRMRRLRDDGALTSRPTLRYEPWAFSVTAAGLGAAGSTLSRPRPIDLATYRHEVGVGWLAVMARRGGFGELSQIVSERRMRSEDGRARAAGGHGHRHGVRLRGVGRTRVSGDGERLHYPDLTLVTASGHRIAFELELSTKEPRRREQILSAYLAYPHYDQVVYLVRTRAARDALQRSAARVGAGDRVRVQMFEWPDGRAPGDPPAAARTARRSPAQTAGAIAGRAARRSLPQRATAELGR